MTTGMVARSLTDERYKQIEPLPDPPPREMFVVNQFSHSARANYTLSWVFRGRTDVFWGGEGFLCIDTRPGSLRFVPDCMVAYGVDPDYVFARNGYVISEMGKPPDFVMEIGSRTTGRIDVAKKREGYASFGVPECWRFDETGGNYHGQPLAGDALIDGVYQPIPLQHESDGTIWGHSETLGLDIYWQDKKLRIKDPGTGEFFPEYNDAMEERDSALIERDTALNERDDATRQRDLEIARRNEVEAELERLRQQLSRLQDENSARRE
ncbi:MAG: Uma2 family endonuclease [Dehalococcoidia bacterium]|nr:Uma2 family endonuclease [Dehalococcoidia bacterium]